jgi:copper homeostasis protein CutC
MYLKISIVCGEQAPRMNTDDVAPSYGLFLTCREGKYIQYYTMIRSQFYYVESTKMQVQKVP